MTDLAIRTLIRPLTVCVHEPDRSATSEAFGAWRTDQLFEMLDERSEATLQRVHTEHDAEFIVELVASPAADGMSLLLLRESLVVMASEQVATLDKPDGWESVAGRFAKMIDDAAECYAPAVPA